MSEPSIPEWVTAVGTVAAAVAAFFAARQSAKAASAARTAVELQRPHPLVVVKFASLFLQNKKPGDDDDKNFELKNIGDSPAFDVELSPLIVGPNRLSIEKVAYLLRNRSVQAKHELEPPTGHVMTSYSGKGAIFAGEVIKFLDTDSTAKTFKNAQDNYEIPFTVSYHALDGRRFEQPYALMMDRLLGRCWTGAVGSLVQPHSLRQP